MATAAFQVIGDGVAPPVVRYLAQQLLEPLVHGTPFVVAAAE
jgi:site-specific DNA-cytosine methylase